MITRPAALGPARLHYNPATLVEVSDRRCCGAGSAGPSLAFDGRKSAERNYVRPLRIDETQAHIYAIQTQSIGGFQCSVHCMPYHETVHRESIDAEVRDLALEFFYWCSRFEFALKGNGRFSAGRGGVVQVDWKSFFREHEASYQSCDAADPLLRSPPDVQRARTGSAREWAPISFGKD